MNIDITSILKINLLVLFVIFLTSCSFIDYEKKPLDINEVHQKNKQVKHNNILNTYLEFKVLNINFERKNIILKKV